MSHPRVRPVFEVMLGVGPEQFYAALREDLARDGVKCRGQVFAKGALLRMKDGEKRVWSPALHVQVEERERVGGGSGSGGIGSGGGGWVLKCRFSPSSPVWTAFIAVYLGLACAAIGAASYGGAQMILGVTPWAFWGVPVAIVVAGFVHGAAFLGQGLGAEDMYEMRRFVEGVGERVGVTG